ncbi:hypothetical protein EJB05_02321, partial [Eragrostis curvula]
MRGLPTCPRLASLWRRYVAPPHGPGPARRGGINEPNAYPPSAAAVLDPIGTHPNSPPSTHLHLFLDDDDDCLWMLAVGSFAHMSDDQRSSGNDGGGGQLQCRRRRGVTVDVELGAALALADMAAAGGGSSCGVGLALGTGPDAAGAASRQQQEPPPRETAAEQMVTDEDEEMASTRLSLELGKVGIHSSSCSSSSSAGRPARQAAATATAPGGAHGPRPRHVLSEAEKEAKRLRRVLANRESARQTILRRQAIRDELARKVADLSSQNESMKKEKDLVMEEYLSLKETNKQLRAQQAHHPSSLSLF